jgi:RTX calcium-binding nonapeptide repeat (4 copies)
MLIAQQSTGGIRHAISLPDDQDHATSVPTSLKTAPAVKTISEMVADLKSAMAPYNGATVTEMIAKTSNAFAPYGGKTVSEMISTTKTAASAAQPSSPSSAKPAEELRFTGTNGNDSFVGRAKDDRFDGGSGHDTLNGGAGHHSVNGGISNDWLLGGIGNDTVIGGAGNDILTGGAGSDVLVGGTEADVFVFERGWGSDRVMDFKVDVDKLDLRAAGVASFQDVAVNQTSLGVTIQYGSDTVLLLGAKAGALDASDFIWA